MLVVHATEVCYRANLINQSMRILFFIGLGQTASSTSKCVCYGATLASACNTTTYARASNRRSPDVGIGILVTMPCYKYDSNELQHGGGITTFVRAGEVIKHDAAIVLTVMKATTK